MSDKLPFEKGLVDLEEIESAYERYDREAEERRDLGRWMEPSINSREGVEYYSGNWYGDD